MNQNKQVASLTTTTRLSPLAKPFTLNRSNHQSGSMLSTQEPCVFSLEHSNNDPFSSLLDSYRKSNLASKGDYGFGQDTLTTTLPVETATHTQEKSLFEQHPSLELHKNGDFDGLNGSHFDIMEDFSLPNYSPCVTGLGNGNEVSYGKQGVDFHKSLFGKGNYVGSSAVDASIFQKGKHAVDGLNPCLTVSDDTFKKSTSAIVAKDILLNSNGSIHTADESSSFRISNCKVAPLKLSTTDMSSAKTTPQEQSFKNLGDSGSDEDSPCWKGTMAFCPTSEESSGSVQFHHVEKATEKHNSLNPLAPQFFPGIGYVNDFVSSNSSAPVATNLLSGEDTLLKTVMAKPPVEMNMGIELRHSSNICGREMAFNMLNDPQSSSVDPVPNSQCMMTQSSSKEGCLKSKGKLVTIVDVDDFVKGTNDPRSSRSKSEVFPAKGHSPTPTSTSTTLSSQVSVVTDLLKTFEGVSRSLIESPKPDVEVMVRAIHVLSELLVQTCVDGVDSCNEHDHIIMIQQIINNLNVFSTKKCGQRIPTLDSTPADSPFCLDRPLELPKGLEMARIETCSVPHQLYPQNDYIGKNRVSKVFGQSGQSPFASCSNEGTEKGNEIAQGIRRSLGKKLDFDKQMHPMAFLFWNLWLDSEAEQCYRKYKTYHGLMEAGVDVNCTNVADLLR